MLEWHASAVARSHAPRFLDCKWHGVKQSDSLVINALNKCCEPTGNVMPARLMTQTQKHWIGQSQLVAITCHSKWQLSKWGKYPAQCHTIELSEWYHSWAVGCGELPAHPDYTGMGRVGQNETGFLGWSNPLWVQNGIERPSLVFWPLKSKMMIIHKNMLK